MNDSQLEAFVRHRYHQTKNIDENEIEHEKPPQAYHSNLRTSIQSTMIDIASKSTSGIDVSHFLNQDSSAHQINANESKIYLDQTKIIYSWKPIVVIVGIDNCTNDSQSSIMYDYMHVIQMLHDIKHFDIIYYNCKHDIIHLQSHYTNNNDMISSNMRESAYKWTVNDLNKFNNEVLDIIQHGDHDYDCLIYVISSHFKTLSNGQHVLYDSDGTEHSCNDKIFDHFNNRKCSKLSKKAKLFVLQGNDDDDVSDAVSEEDKKADFASQYKRIIYAKHESNIDQCQ